MIYNCPSVTRGLIKVAGLVEIIPFFFFLSFLFPNSLSREPNNGLSCLTSEDDLTDANFSKPHKSLTLVHLSFLEIASSFSQVELLGQEQTLCSSEIPYCTCWNPKTWRQMLPPVTLPAHHDPRFHPIPSQMLPLFSFLSFYVNLGIKSTAKLWTFCCRLWH